jgi:hypothetical protein
MMRNKAKCLNCGDIVESKHRNDWVSCSCFSHDTKNPRGFFLDGGDDYSRYGGNVSDIHWLCDEEEE